MTMVKVEDKNMFEGLIVGKHTFNLALNGGAYTKYTIWPYRGKDTSQKSKFRVKSHFCDNVETVSIEEMYDPKRYHFLEGIEKGALYLESNKS